MSVRAPSTEVLWARVEGLIDASNLAGLRTHRLEVLASRRYRALGREVPHEFQEEERLAAIAAITAPQVIERVTSGYDGSMIVLKGPATAALYPDPVMRGYGDIDLLADDPARAQKALLGAGFKLVGDPGLYVDIHHLQPLQSRGLLLPVEIHSRPKWVAPLPGPSVNELFEAAAAFPGNSGVLQLPPEHTVLLLAAHSWAHEPLRRLRDVIDIALAMHRADREEIEGLARRWGIARLWHTTRDVVDCITGEVQPPVALRTWARNIRMARERTVLENHLQRWVSDFWALPAGQAAARVPANVIRDIRPEGVEPWAAKAARTALALRNARRPRSQHEKELRGRSEPRA